jgi:hypothetical protein
MPDALQLLRQLRREKQSAGESSAPSLPQPKPAAPVVADSLWETASLCVREWRVADHTGSDVRPLRLLEDPMGTMSAGNGATLWDAAMALTLALQQEQPWVGVRVLELGAGVGLVGMALASLGAQVVSSERGIALPLLKKNLAENAPFAGDAVALEIDWASDEVSALCTVKARCTGCALACGDGRDPRPCLRVFMLHVRPCQMSTSLLVPTSSSLPTQRCTACSHA